MLDYTVIVNVRHQFGNKNINVGVFAGEQKDFSFDCPGIDASQTSLLFFQSSRVLREQSLLINGSIVFGGIPQGPISLTASSDPDDFPVSVITTGWSANVMLVQPNTLKEFGNVMRVASVEKIEFLIDNVVLLLKRKSSSPVIST